MYIERITRRGKHLYTEVHKLILVKTREQIHPLTLHHIAYEEIKGLLKPFSLAGLFNDVIKIGISRDTGNATDL